MSILSIDPLDLWINSKKYQILGRPNFGLDAEKYYDMPPNLVSRNMILDRMAKDIGRKYLSLVRVKVERIDNKTIVSIKKRKAK